MQICSGFPEAKGLSLSSYLIMPDLLRHTDETHPDHQNLSQAHVADYVNNSMQMALTNSVILRIQRHLGADITQLLDSSCVFKKEGKFRRIKGQGPKVTDRLQMFLFNDLLLVAEKSFGHIRSYKWKVNIPMKGLWLQDIPDNSLPDLPKMYKNLFYIVGPKKAWIFFPKKGTLQEKSNWMRDLQQCIDDYIAKHPEAQGVRNEFKLPFISTSASTITIRRKGRTAAGEPSEQPTTQRSFLGSPPLLSSMMSLSLSPSPSPTRASRSYSDLPPPGKLSTSPPTTSTVGGGAKGSTLRRPRPAPLIITDPQAIFSADNSPPSPPTLKREAAPVTTTSSPSLLSLAMRTASPPSPSPLMPSPPPLSPTGGGSSRERSAPTVPPRPEKPQQPSPTLSSSSLGITTRASPAVPQNVFATRQPTSPLPPSRPSVETQSPSSTSNWDATLKEDRPLCSNRHFCTLKDPQHWVEYKHWVDGGGKLYGSNTLDLRSRVRSPHQEPKKGNP
ncbi:FYVEtype Zn finger-containing protein [Acanthamoeba castellanii str. Neff]|uniref:FYVEtype Zn finger-containing protein n=1 Tax=Acanthamoeba castellanii (strain ATCC 30010 / Neff) TaxID=1257118 RepID=L8GL29_ACACF|nr:FYVEtype Zn finger-containing protein [Acanthamoeba castellanii str. Neff]ELR13534.1 FYVEtype Zn finger-containing protein [Acanthamoeba castellanii str. Neff]